MKKDKSYALLKQEKIKRKKKIKIALGITVPLAVIVIAALALILPIVISFYNNSYVEVAIVDRPNEYVRPEMDEQPSGWEDVTLSEEEMDYDIPEESETLPNNINSGSYEDYDRNNSFGSSANAINVYGKTPIYRVAQKDPDIINILVLGTDSRDVTRERGRSDAIIILSYNKKTDRIKMLSILRDSLVPIEGHRWNRINAAYSFDGVGLAINTVNEVFDLDIQRFVVIDFNGVKNFINQVGGVDIKLTAAEAKYFNKRNIFPEQVEAGVCHLNGSQALEYMRIRKIDSDFVRTSRQQKVIQVLANKIVAEKSLPEMYSLADFAFKITKTNISFAELTSVIAAFSDKNGGIDFDSDHVPFDGTYAYRRYNGMSIISFDVDDAASRINKFIYG